MAPKASTPVGKGMKRKASAQEQVQLLQKRSREVAFRDKFGKLQQILRQNMYLTDSVTTHLETVLGKSLDDILESGAGERGADSVTPRKPKAEPDAGDEGGSGPAPAVGCGNCERSSAGSSRNAAEEPEPDGEEAENDDDAGAMQTWGYTRLSSYSITLLMNILSQIEPSSLWKHALKAVVIRGKRKESTEALLNIVEYCTGLTPSWSATGKYKRWSTLYAYMQALNIARGRRARELIMPVRWYNQNGMYSVRVVGKKLFLKQNWTGEEIEVPGSTIKKLGGGVVDVSVAENWSETQALLVSPKVPDGQLCILLLSNHLVVKEAMDEFYNTLDSLPAKHAPVKRAADEEEDAEVKQEVKQEEEQDEVNEGYKDELISALRGALEAGGGGDDGGGCLFSEGGGGGGGRRVEPGGGRRLEVGDLRRVRRHAAAAHGLISFRRVWAASRVMSPSACCVESCAVGGGGGCRVWQSTIVEISYVGRVRCRSVVHSGVAAAIPAEQSWRASVPPIRNGPKMSPDGVRSSLEFHIASHFRHPPFYALGPQSSTPESCGYSTIWQVGIAFLPRPSATYHCRVVM